MKTTNKSSASENESSDQVLPSTPGNEKEGADVPTAIPLECIKAMGTL